MHDISHESNNVFLARIGGDAVLAVVNPDSDLPGVDEILVVEDGGGVRFAARLLGRSGPRIRGSEASLVGRFRIEPGGEPISAFVTSGPPSVHTHDWGALGLPDGLETRLVPSSSSERGDDVGIANASRGFNDLDASPRLMVAPGDSIRIGSQSGTVYAVDRRNATLELEPDGGGELVTFDLDELPDVHAGEERP